MSATEWGVEIIDSRIRYGMNLRQRADAVNWNVFRLLKGKLTAGPDVDGSAFYAVTWSLADGRKHSTVHENEIKYEDLILND
ncbi:MAG: hypothetical protein R3293_12800 [Candidatus Promineifilaceae bacterium]|nr:hypothetical protein [Candidatus Promineifilaceae bacterium]